MKTILYLSPHLDDVVFSCSGHLKAETEKGNNTIVATIFTEGDHKHRKKEDLKALEKCGAKHIWLGELDAPYRDKFYQSFDSIIFGEDLNHTIDLASVIQSINPDQIIAPLAVGTHIDHRVVFDSVYSLKNTNLLFYADRPYSLIKGYTELRLNTLGYNCDLPPFIEFWLSFLNASYVKAYLTHEKELVRDKLKKIYRPTQEKQNYEIASTHLPFQDAILCYESQLESFIQAEAFCIPETLYRLL